MVPIRTGVDMYESLNSIRSRAGYTAAWDTPEAWEAAWTQELRARKITAGIVAVRARQAAFNSRQSREPISDILPLLPARDEHDPITEVVAYNGAAGIVSEPGPLLVAAN
jgi:hypothetical protein